MRLPASSLDTRPHKRPRGIGSDPFDRGEPGLGAVLVDRDGEHRGVYRPDQPTVDEGSAQLGLRHPARAPVPRLAVTETHQVVHPPGPQSRPQAVDINRALLVVEDMEHATVGDDVELPPQAVEVQYIPTSNIAPMPRSWAFARARSMASSAMSTPIASAPCIGQLHEVGLRPADVPGRRSLVDAVPGGVLSHGLRLAAKGLVHVDCLELFSLLVLLSRLNEFLDREHLGGASKKTIECTRLPLSSIVDNGGLKAIAQ